MLAHSTTSGKRVRLYGTTAVALSFSRYKRNGRICLRLVHAEGGHAGEVCASCTVNLAGVAMQEDEVAIKTWHENVGMLGWLMEEGIVSAPLHYASFGGVFIPVCSLLAGEERVE